MKVMLLAAGHGERMRPLTDNTPKPMLPILGKPLLQYHIEALVQAGLHELVINTARNGQVIEEYFAAGEKFNAHIQYSAEGDDPLETGGGIKQALPLLGEAPFLAINADIWTDFSYADIIIDSPMLAHLVLVRNPEHNPQGDFALEHGMVKNSGTSCLTFSGIGLYQTRLFHDTAEQKFPLAPLLRRAADNQQVSGQQYNGAWFDIGTPQRLVEIETYLQSK